MLTVIIWLGSGFAFVVGVFVGAVMLRWMRRSDDDATARVLEHYSRSESLMIERNDIERACVDAIQRLATAAEKS